MAAREHSENFSMRVTPQESQDWKDAAALLSEQMGVPVSVSAFLRVAAREKIATLKDEKKRKGGK